MQEFFALFGSPSVQLVIGDREFIGEDWLAWLDEQGFAFLIRLRKDDPLVHPTLGKGAAMHHFKRACRGKKRAWKLWGTTVFVAGKRLADGDYLILASNRYALDQLWLYRFRWGIECLFQALKGRGFDLEGCTTTRMGAFFGLLSLTLLWCVRMGMYLETIDPVKLLRFGRGAKRCYVKIGDIVSTARGRLFP